LLVRQQSRQRDKNDKQVNIKAYFHEMRAQMEESEPSSSDDSEDFVTPRPQPESSDELSSSESWSGEEDAGRADNPPPLCPLSVLLGSPNKSSALPNISTDGPPSPLSQYQSRISFSATFPNPLGRTLASSASAPALGLSARPSLQPGNPFRSASPFPLRVRKNRLFLSHGHHSKWLNLIIYQHHKLHDLRQCCFATSTQRK
jgi:hypothetical protein